ncbi:hypothetical protein Taro_017554 [Colocasia esculenta]|uniref:Uncharacterized protein n=1 Tax=Colocasia esculenta TaxID=4460 RepID=A0A843UWF0_COLES|nr:hypothetical protein [Colocasia esculenta]
MDLPRAGRRVEAENMGTFFFLQGMGCRQMGCWLSTDAYRVQFLGSVKAYLSTGYSGLSTGALKLQL